MNKYKQFSKVKVNSRYRACGRKQAYDNKEAAYQKGQDSYECPFCGKWHRKSITKGVKGAAFYSS